MQRRRSLVVLLLGLSPLVSPLAAQQPPQRPTVVEIFGLRRWTPQMVEDSVARFQPGITLADHACAVILRDSVGFANAAAITLMFPDTIWVAVPVVEPELKSLVRFPRYRVKRAPAAEWADLRAILEKAPRAMEPLQDPRVLLAGADSFAGRPLSDTTRLLRQRLRTHTSARDWELARGAIATDSSYSNRTIAALVLSNFPQRDSTYYLLADALRANDVGGGSAEMVLRALARGAPRRVDWAPARETLRALFGGTDLFAYTSLMDVLVKTEVDRGLGRELAQVFPDLLLDHVSARNPLARGAAHEFLAYVSGRDFGRDRRAWQEWLARQ